jgi:hypothetical protein
MLVVLESRIQALYPNQLKKPISDPVFLVKICSENLAVSLDTARILRRNFSSKMLRHSSTSSVGLGIVCNSQNYESEELVKLKPIFRLPHLILRLGSKVVMQEPAKLLCVGSIPTPASKLHFFLSVTLGALR